ncbi:MULTISPECIES: DUF2805 domain-containing protein [Flavobacterium]|jgi:uncharacterized protein (TIGR03643 family)|uniref:Uncharacterized protein (TIGR03643 family) n=1 Tax=Flavobacterium lindanitolerans TaxID=428988 RepID=A0A497TXA8_9FLAO|nr:MULTISPECIES: DUF2805 domain-containing protein [Flavobacterium]MBU7569696.1 DUF2805 domain-containing protein [Flavobacterium sp.]PZQ86509.1 MAG: DUF2805 domain-containing protein [Flavobacterium johnsoniae]KQS48581.1 hypothetical protein ASG38_05410 [Flavobacterium sp. Leaf359]MBL7867934.1 DUF2805 domain-containing protein [Flavobacterium lindanitolerans]MDQ7960434.1 DUF2805 domain-containing protein [Flavobacterium lindanitolerans]
MKKGKNIELTREENEKLVTLALEERNPFEIIKKELGLAEKDVIEIMKKRLTADKFELWKKKAMASKPKPKPPKIDDFDEDLDGKYYIKNKFD